jgi:hypothetical protein
MYETLIKYHGRQGARKLLMQSAVGDAYVKRMVRLATDDAYKAGRAMTLRPVEAM